MKIFLNRSNSFHKPRRKIDSFTCSKRISVRDFFYFKLLDWSRISDFIPESERCLIFVETKRSADYIGALLSQRQLMSTTMHGDRTQRQRHEAVEQFTNGKCPILVATSVAARGLDFPLIGYVVNYDLPDSTDFYIHRIGRTGKDCERKDLLRWFEGVYLGRAGHLGRSISFFDPGRESDRTIAPELVQRLAEVEIDCENLLTLSFL